MSEQHDQMVDLGDACPTPTCNASAGEIGRDKALGIDLFQCRKCGAAWFDCLTQPTVEAEYRRHA